MSVEVFRYRLLRRLLGLRIDRGGDLQTLGVQRLLVDIEQLHQLFGHLALDEPGGAGGLILRPGLIGRHGRWKHLCRAITRRQGFGFHHAVEHPIPARRGALGIDSRVQRGRPTNQRRQQRTFGDGELLDGLVEIGLGGGRNPVSAPAEIYDVQVCLQHIVFGPLTRHLGGDDQFLGLAHQTPEPVLCRTDQRVFNILLGDRRPTLQIAAEQVVLDRPREAAYREARVRIEVAVFGGDHRLTHVHRYLAEVDINPITFRWNDFADLRAVDGQDCRDLIGTDVARLGNVDDEVSHRESDDRQQKHHRCGEIGRSSHPPPIHPVGPAHPSRWSGSGSRPLVPRGGRPRAVQRCLDLLDRVPWRGWLGAVQRRLDLLDRVGTTRRSVIDDGREDGGQPVVGTNLAALAGRRTLLCVTGRLVVAPFVLPRVTQRYSVAVRAPLRAVRVPRVPFGGRAAPSTYDLTK